MYVPPKQKEKAARCFWWKMDRPCTLRFLIVDEAIRKSGDFGSVSLPLPLIHIPSSGKRMASMVVSATAVRTE